MESERTESSYWCGTYAWDQNWSSAAAADGECGEVTSFFSQAAFEMKVSHHVGKWTPKNNLETQNNKARILKEKRPKNAHSADIKNVKREIRQDTEKDTQSLKQFNTARTIVGCVLLFTFWPHGNLLIHLNLHSSHKWKVKGLCNSSRVSQVTACFIDNVQHSRYYDMSLWMIAIEPMLICCHWSAARFRFANPAKTAKMIWWWSVRKFPSQNLSHMRTEVSFGISLE